MDVTRLLRALGRRPLFPDTPVEALATLRRTFGDLAADSPLTLRPAGQPVAVPTAEHADAGRHRATRHQSAA